MIKIIGNINGDQVEISGNYDEIVEDVKRLGDAGDLIDSLTNFKQVAMAKGAFTAPTGAATSKPKSTPPPASGQVPSCQHGQAKWASGVNKTTQVAYSGYYCPGRYPNNCKPSKLSD